MLFRYIQQWIFILAIHSTRAESDEKEKRTEVKIPTTANTISGFSCDYEDILEVHCRCTAPSVTIPTNLPANVTSLIVEDSEMEILHSNSLQPYASTLKVLTLEHLANFVAIESGAFANLNDLDTIYLHRLPNLITIEPEVFNVHLPNLKILKIQDTGLTEVPDFKGLRTDSVLHLIDLEHNNIQKISHKQISGIKVEQLLLNFNQLEVVEAEAFHDSQIATLSLRGNVRLTQLHPRAFTGLLSLRRIDLSSTSITNLPTDGLRDVDVLKVQDTETLKVFPSIYNFQFIREAWLTYPYHCCAFKFPHTHNPSEYVRYNKFIQQLQEACNHKNSTLNNLIFNHNYPALRSLLQWMPLNATLSDTNYDDSLWMNGDEVFHNITTTRNHPVTAVCGNISKNYHEVECHPAPDAFNPCEDIMGNWALRIPVWFISLSAIIGNLFVVIVIVTSHFRLTVSKFLMCNLAAADLCIGLHLFLIAVVDACSIGSYFNYAIDWQEGDGCRVAGFLTIFGNVLSVYTLAVITTERWYTITWAIHLNRRLKLSTAVRVMGAGWACALFLASMPLVGVSNYSKTSICLPLEHRGRVDAIYLATLLAFNATAFVLICICYGSMYRSIREGNLSSTTSSVRSDMTVAKRMALLVFTDFACWAPIAFFGLTALLGYPLITVTNTKILLVFFYPLNSCANPYLYALLTQQYRRDFFILMGKYGLCKDRAERHRGAIGGVPLPYGSGPQYKRPNGEGILKRGTGNNSNRSSMMTTLVSVEMPVVRSCSKYNSRPDPFNTLPEKLVKSNNLMEDGLNRLNTSENL